MTLGFEVRDTHDDIVFTTEDSHISVFKKGEESVSVGAGATGQITVNHLLGYVPACDVYMKQNNTELGDYEVRLPHSTTLATGAATENIRGLGRYFINQDSLIIKVTNQGSTTKTFTFGYEVLVNKLADS